MASVCLLGVVVSVAADSTAPIFKQMRVGPRYPQRDFSQLAQWQVLSVLGPDRILVRQGQKQQTVKLVGVGEAKAGQGEEPGGDYESRATEFLNNLLAGERVYVLELGRGGLRGELLAVKVFRAPDGLYVNLELVRQGYARMSSAGLKGELKIFQAYEQRARQAGKGLWATLPAGAASRGVGKERVYVTKTGKKYHRAACTFLTKSKISMSLVEAKKRGFTGCKVCKPGR